MRVSVVFAIWISVTQRTYVFRRWRKRKFMAASSSVNLLGFAIARDKEKKISAGCDEFSFACEWDWPALAWEQAPGEEGGKNSASAKQKNERSNRGEIGLRSGSPIDCLQVRPALILPSWRLSAIKESYVRGGSRYMKNIWGKSHSAEVCQKNNCEICELKMPQNSFQHSHFDGSL